MKVFVDFMHALVAIMKILVDKHFKKKHEVNCIKSRRV
jgi:hypothetical protein